MRVQRVSNPSPPTFIYGVVDSASVCPGNPDEKFIFYGESKKGGGKVYTSGERTAAINDAFQVSLNGEVYQQTIRTMDCTWATLAIL